MVERDRGFLALAVAAPAQPDDPEDRKATMTRYMLGFGRRPIPAPLFRHVTPIHDTAPAKSWRQTRQALIMADQTGAANTTPAELTELRARLDRAVTPTGDQP